MNEVEKPQPKRNEYAEMARHSFLALADLADTMADSPEATHHQVLQETVEAVTGLWHRLVWSDRTLNARECLVLDILMHEATELGITFPDVQKHDGPEVDPIPQLLRRARHHDQVHRTHLVETVLVTLESFGYALLAADRNISQPELDNLHEYTFFLRSWLQGPADV